MSLSRREALAAAGAFVSGRALAASDRPSAQSDLADLDATATAGAIRDGHISAHEAVEAAIARAERLDTQVHAIVTPTFERAREQARTASGPWAGVPFFVKDLTNVAGVPTQFGSRAFKRFVPNAQSQLVDAMFGLGLVSLGKSATPEFGLTATTEPLAGPVVRNPWNLGRSTGGSSGGAAALVAAGVVPVAHGSDGGGSIRIPASCCGLVGLKLSRGRTPPGDDRTARPVDIVVHGIESRTVRDAAAFAAMIEIASDMPAIGLIERPSSERRGVALWTESPAGGPVDRQSQEAARKAARLLAELGHRVEEIAPPFDYGVYRDFSLLWAAFTAEIVAGWEKHAGRPGGYEEFEPFTLGLAAEFAAAKEAFPAALARLRQFAAIYDSRFAEYDVLLSPTLASPPPPLGYLTTSIRFETVLDRLSSYVCFTQTINVAGAPAISLPLGMSRDESPIGVQLAAGRGQERMLLQLAYELEEAAPWAKRKPPIFG